MLSVEEVLKSRNIEYRERGRDYVVSCLNPEHDDTNPSMNIDKIEGHFNCLSCGYKGSIFSLFGEKVNALQKLKNQLKEKIATRLSESIGFEVPENAVAFDRDYRGISGETYKHFGAFEHNQPEFVGRIVFPITGLHGRIVGFNGRHLTQNHATKYLIHPPGASFGFFPPRPEHVNGEIILVEGIFDMLNLWDKGIKNVTCCFGTRKVTKDKLELLQMQGVTRILVFFDADRAGEEASKEVLALIESLNIDCDTISWEDSNVDPGELTWDEIQEIKEGLYGSEDRPSRD